MANFEDKFIEEVSRLTPGSNVNDENANLPHLELEHNLKFLFNTLSNTGVNNSQLLSLIYGNLLDYDSNGNKVFFNGGKFDCFEKKQIWLAINDGAVTNDVDIQDEGAEDLLVYKGRTSYTDDAGEHGVWLERTFYIPKFLRGSELIFGLKGTGVYLNSSITDVPFDLNIPFCDNSDIPNVFAVGNPPCLTPGTTGTTGTSGSPTSGSPTTGSPADGTCEPDLSTNCYARYEDIGIEILGALQQIQNIEVIGPWPHHSLYAKQDDWLPEYRSTFVKFKVGENTENITIRIRRTRSDGALAFSNAFLGGLPSPFDSYELNDADVNELYDFVNGVTKWNVTTVNGRHVGADCNSSKLSNLLTKRDMFCINQFIRDIEEYDWDQLNGPIPNEVEFESTVPFSVPATHGLEFDPEQTRYAHFDMRVDGPNPGLAYYGATFIVNENDFSESDTCVDAESDDDICGYVKFDVWVKVVNTNDFANPSFVDYERFTYSVPISKRLLDGGLGYFEIYGDFYNGLTEGRGALAYFTISRDAESDEDTFGGNINIIGSKIGLAVPPDDIPDVNNYDDLFIGGIEDCSI